MELEFDRFHVADSDKVQWGELVKRWAKGELPKPKTLSELKLQLINEAAIPEAAVHFPDYVTGLVFVQNDKHILTVRLPPKDLVELAEDFLRSNPDARYQIPAFYAQFAAQLSETEKLDLQAARIGEYSVNSCL